LVSSLIIKRKIKRKIFKKKTYILKNNLIKISKGFGLIKYSFYKAYTNLNLFREVDTITSYCTNSILSTITVSQKKYNHKATITSHKILSTFSIGSVIRYFKVNRSKYVRRSTKGVKIFLNFLKRIFFKRYFSKNIDYFLLNIVGVDYYIKTNKKIFRKFFLKSGTPTTFLMYNIKVSFTKLKEKKIKSIKKRLRKKIILNFLKKKN
jgi:hypothetical protein